MSITSGPIVPWRTGKVMDGEPSEKLRLAVRSVMFSAPSVVHAAAAPPIDCASQPFLAALCGLPPPQACSLPANSSCRAQRFEHRLERGVLRLGPARDHVPQLVVRVVEQPPQRGGL